MMDLCDEIEWISFGWICREDLTEVWIFLWIGLNLVWILWMDLMVWIITSCGFAMCIELGCMKLIGKNDTHIYFFYSMNLV